MTDKNNYVFDKGPSGNLVFVGNFEGLYAAESDPWGQSGNDEHLRHYYPFSRQRLAACLKTIGRKARVLEVGCGHGHVIHYLMGELGQDFEIHGMDISRLACQQAQEIYPKYTFITADMCEKNLSFSQKYDVVIFGQILWYLLHQFDSAIENAWSALAEDGYLIFSQAFLSEQKLGRDIVDGFDGLIDYMATRSPKPFSLSYAHLDDSGQFGNYSDGIAAFRKKIER